MTFRVAAVIDSFTGNTYCCYVAFFFDRYVQIKIAVSISLLFAKFLICANRYFFAESNENEPDFAYLKVVTLA